MITLTKTEEQKDVILLKDFQEKVDKFNIVSDPKKYTVTITSKTLSTEEIKSSIFLESGQHIKQHKTNSLIWTLIWTTY